ncbi:uncharacterized protein LOC115632762 [Scaptodrosophila lebanonensis]|uniref:Uncharacterized protein LOC115632762 n=1 Tax=Drosophila lebanonensis TaxID=7225 RepID=A0A6J2UCQ7_DROLE|nr:uncharacterized protein LOC115632762 [Scaptodrosophila lebanonensis]
MHGDEGNAAAAPPDSTDSMGSTPAAVPRRPKPGILRLDINKPRRSSGGSVDFRSISHAGSQSAGAGTGMGVATAAGAHSEVSELDKVHSWE